MSDDPALASLADDLVAAHRILAEHGILDAFGHVSARDPRRADRFLIPRSLAPALVTHDDLMTLDLDGNPVDQDTRRPFLERFRTARSPRTDVQVSTATQSAFRSRVVRCTSTIHHVSGFLSSPTPVFDIRQAGTDMSAQRRARRRARRSAGGTRSC
jgi:hypothetical protein